MEGQKSRHCRNESDPLLGLYSSTIAASSSTRSSQNGGYYGNPASFVENNSNAPSSNSKQQGDSAPSKDKNKKKKRTGGYRVHRVSYTAQNHVQVLFRTYASAFPQVLPFVCANVAWTLIIWYLKSHDFIDLTFHSSVGHSFMGLLVSFLIVSRSKISYDRFMENRRHLAACYRACVSAYNNIICMAFISLFFQLVST